MNVQGIHHLHLRTTDWHRSVAFWRDLGFTLEDADGHAGRLRPPGGGPYIWLEAVPEGTQLDPEVYLAVSEPSSPGDAVDVVSSFTPSHWGTRVMEVRDPDGRTFHLEVHGDPAGG